MKTIYDNIEQNSPEWYELRLGIPTASAFSKILAKGEGKTRNEYMRKLAGERLTGRQAYSYTTQQMERGHEQEDEARQFYRMMTENEVKQIGFIRNGEIGASPDSLIVGKPGGLEIKTMEPHILIDVLERRRYPPEHKAQLMGHMLVGELEFVDFAGYSPGLPLYRETVRRDEQYIKTLSEEIDRFLYELNEMVNRIKNYSEAA